MGKRFISKNELEVLQKKIDELKSINSWTKKKHDLRDDLITYIADNYKYFWYAPYANFQKNEGGRYYSWDYEIRITPKNQRGLLSEYRGKELFVICTYIYKYGKRELLIIPLK